MALVSQSAGTAAAASGASPTTVATTTALAVGNALFVLMAYDNSGASGADPLTAFAVAPAAGAMTGASVQTGLNAPGAVASGGLAIRANSYAVTTAIPSGTNISISWTGTVVARAIAMVKVSSNVGGSAVYRTNSGATGTNVVASAAPSLVTPSVTSGELVLGWGGIENGINAGSDSDTLNGTWSAAITSFTTGMAVTVQTKTVTATGAQTFNPTSPASDWIVGALIFTEVIPPALPVSVTRPIKPRGASINANFY